MTFYSLKPIDWLMVNFIQNSVCHPEMSGDVCQKRMREAKPECERGLFQHVGKQ